ncbi:MAG TPA: PPOX class F420-dependent oxidoreductase [Streptosporangiaceae bacterium]|nr:PPOX class F420-dependent oxidoreductase [Streptosporangiaceae bacterium]
MASTTDPEVNKFLTGGTRTGKIAYTNAAGRVLVAPIWFIVEDGDLIFNTGADTVKGQFLARERQVTICVDLEEPPYAFVQVQGNAELSNDPSELLRTATAIAARYVGPERADEFGQRNGVPGELVVRVRPTKVLAAFDMIA